MKALWAKHRHLLHDAYLSGVLTYIAIGLTRGWFH